MIRITMLLAMLMASPAFARQIDPGGRVADYIARVEHDRGQRHEIAGDCMSACTIWLGNSATCVYPDAEVWFHAASDQTATLAMIAYYPPRIRAYVAPFMRSRELRAVSGRRLIDLGARSCEIEP